MPKLNRGLAPKMYSCRLNHTVWAKGKAIIALVKTTAGSDRQANWPRVPMDRPMEMVMWIDRPIARSPGEKTAIHRQHAVRGGKLEQRHHSLAINASSCLSASAQACAGRFWPTRNSVPAWPMSSREAGLAAIG